MIEASEKLRQLATLLMSKTYLIPLYTFFEKAKIVIKFSNIEEAFKELILISNSINVPPDQRGYSTRNFEAEKKIKKLLNLRS